MTALLERTEGWAVGLHLAALYLDRDHIDAAINHLSGRDRVIADYLISELLQQLSHENEIFCCGPVSWRRSMDHSQTASQDEPTVTRCWSISLEQVLLSSEQMASQGYFASHRMLGDLLAYRFTMEQPQALQPTHAAAAEWLLTATVFDDEIATLAADHADLPIGRLTVLTARFEVVPRWPARRWTASNAATFCDGCDQLTVARDARVGATRWGKAPRGRHFYGIVTGRVLRDARQGQPLSPAALPVEVRLAGHGRWSICAIVRWGPR